MPRYSRASERAYEADMRADAFRRDMMRAKAPRTWALLGKVREALDACTYEQEGGDYHGKLQRLDIAISVAAERGAEYAQASIDYAMGVIEHGDEDRIVHLTDGDNGATGFCGSASGLRTLEESRATCPRCSDEDD